MSFLGSRKAIARGSERGKSPLLRFASFMYVSDGSEQGQVRS
jgi:hypothetical protein